MKRSHFTLGALMMGSVVMGLGSTAQAAGKADFSYTQVMALIESAAGDSKTVTEKIAGKTVGMNLKRSGERVLLVDAKDGLFFVCEKGDAGFKGGEVVLKMARFVSSDDTEPTVFLENCATSP